MHYGIKSKIIKLKKPVFYEYKGREYKLTKQLVLEEDIYDYYDGLLMEAGSLGAMFTDDCEIGEDVYLNQNTVVINSKITKTFYPHQAIIVGCDIYNCDIDNSLISRDPNRNHTTIPELDNSSIKNSRICIGEFDEFTKDTWYLNIGIYSSSIQHCTIDGLRYFRNSCGLNLKLSGEIMLTDAVVGEVNANGRIKADANVYFNRYDLKAQACFMEKDSVLTIMDCTDSALYEQGIQVFINNTENIPINYLDDNGFMMPFANVPLQEIDKAIDNAFLPNAAKKVLQATIDHYKVVNGLD